LRVDSSERQDEGDLRKKQEPGTLRIWRAEEMEALELRVGTGFEHPYPKHWHEEFFITAITGGAARFHYAGSDHAATPGTLVMIVPGEIHTHDSDGGRSFRSMHMPWSFLENVAADIIEQPSLPAFSSSLVSEPKTFREFISLHQTLENSGTRLEQETLMLGFFETLLRRVSSTNSSQLKGGREILAVRRAQQYLQEHFNREVTLEELATHVNLSPYYFHRSFCRQTGIPPHAYQIQLRLLHARELLRKRWPVVAIAQAAGFADQSHLTRLFKRFTGVTPAQYATQGKNVQDDYFESR
jgi:AraC-like DNA-binding protein